MDREQFREAGYAAIDRVCDYFAELETQENVLPTVAPGEIGRLIPDAAPLDGEQWSDIAKDFDQIILPGITHWQHPGFLAFFPANTTYESILSDIYAGAVSNPGFSWICSPACTELEVVMMDWVAKLLGLDSSFHHASGIGGGIIMGSASEACLTVCIAARERALRLLPGTPADRLVIYGTTQTHSLGAKAALILGLSFRAIETIAEDKWALRGEELKRVLDEDKANGKVPFVLLATLGSTSTGAIDHLAEITAVAAEFPELFLHVDAAWAGVFLACPELRQECGLEAINKRSSAVTAAKGICASGEVHSFCTNLHKSGLVTFDASCLWIRDRKLLTEALDITPPFLRNKHSDEGTVVDFRNWQMPLGRRFRSLKLFFVLRSYGVSGFQKHLRRQINLAAYFEKLVLANPRFELFVPRRLALVVFRIKANTVELADRVNREFFVSVAERRDIFLTPTTVGGLYCTRVAIGTTLLTEAYLDKAWKIINELAEEARLGLPSE